jgi:hypothetical protein
MGYRRTFLEGGFSASSSGPLTSSGVRFFPRADLGLAAAGSPSAGCSSVSSATFGAAPLLVLGLAGAFFVTWGLGCSLIRDERRGSPGSAGAAAALRGIYG